jgi:hypothetical protein
MHTDPLWPGLETHYADSGEFLFALNGEQPKKIRPCSRYDVRRGKHGGIRRYYACWGDAALGNRVFWRDLSALGMRRARFLDKIVRYIVRQVKRFRNFAAKQTKRKREEKEDMQPLNESHG